MRTMVKAGLAVILVVMVSAAAGGAQPTDPYEILAKHYEAMGGLENLQKQETVHMTGTVVIEGTGLEGPFEQWIMTPDRSRMNVDLKIFTQTTGDDGEYAWTVDPNGKLNIHRDSITMARRRVSRLMAEYAHIDSRSEYFRLDYAGTETIDEVPCHVVRITNTINTDTSFRYFSTADYMPVKQVDIQPSETSETTFGDFREVEGVLVPFAQTVISRPTNMVQQVTITAFEVNVPVDTTLFEPPGQDVEDFRFTRDNKVEGVPFKFIENHIYLPLTVGGVKRLWVLDSGAGMTVIDRDFADELGLEVEGSMKGQGVGNLVDVSFTTLPEFSLPGLEFRPQKAAVIKLKPLFHQWLGMEVVGILGYDFLSRLVVKVDYAEEKLSFYHPDHFEYKGLGTVIEAPLSNDNMFHVPLTVDGEYGGLWNLDLGAGGMSFHYPFARDHGLLDRPGIGRLGHGAGGSQKERQAQFDVIEFAGFTVEKPLIDFPLEKGEGAFASAALTGNIGSTLLRHFVIYLDYKRGQVIVEKGQDFGRIFPRDNSGIQIENTEEGEIRIISVGEGTPGAKAGLMVGDVITAVNGIGMEYLDGIVAMYKIFRAEPGTKYELSIRREGESRKVKLTLKDLFD